MSIRLGPSQVGLQSGQECKCDNLVYPMLRRVGGRETPALGLVLLEPSIFNPIFTFGFGSSCSRGRGWNMRRGRSSLERRLCAIARGSRAAALTSTPMCPARLLLEMFFLSLARRSQSLMVVMMEL